MGACVGVYQRMHLMWRPEVVVRNRLSFTVFSKADLSVNPEIPDLAGLVIACSGDFSDPAFQGCHFHVIQTPLRV